MLFSSLSKKEVLDINANRAGSLVDVDLNVSDGTINHFMLKTGLTKRVKITPDKIEKVGEKVILKISKMEAERPPASVK